MTRAHLRSLSRRSGLLLWTTVLCALMLMQIPSQLSSSCAGKDTACEEIGLAQLLYPTCWLLTIELQLVCGVPKQEERKEMF